jgi:hypothetical protein
VPPPWQNSLPLDEYTTIKVVVYYYSGRWIPLKYCRLIKAIELYRKAKLEGREIFIFPPDFQADDS